MKKKGTHFGDVRDTEKGRRSSMPARTRDGATHPGGRALRRALAILGARQKAFNGKQGYTMPGSMKG